MPHHEQIKIDGRIGDIFFHRFVVELDDGGKILADLGPKGVEAFPIRAGMKITAEGEMKPSELKIERIAEKGGTFVAVEHKKKHPPHHGPHHGHHDRADPDVAIRAVEAAGLRPVGEPRRKPKHFEILARRGVALVECHVELDGHIRKEKPVGPHEPKWSALASHAASHQRSL